MSVSLLTTKLYVPPTRPELVPRPRLLERLHAGLGPRTFPDGEGFARKLTLVSAPAGFGKTTLVAEWLKGLQHPYAWLSLDENDNDPARFLIYLQAALQRIDAEIGQTAQAMLETPQPPPPEALLTSLLNDIAAAPRPFILVLDDYHLIHTLSIHQQLSFLVEHQPPRMHLIIATREEPPLPLSLLRARGQMVDIRQADLRFTAEETADFLRRVTQVDLSSTDLTALHRRTEGWIAGLQLAALSMRGRDDVQQFVASFSGSQRYILDYLMDEVFQRQPADVRDFLLRTSILDRFNAPLCDAVCSDSTTAEAGRKSRRVLRALEQANLFIVPLDESRQWYRYHHLFTDLLRHRLEIEAPHDLADLHKRASRWYAENGFPADAVRHTLAAADWQRAVDLLLNIGDSLLKVGEVATLLRWYQALPAEVVRADPELCINFAWLLILTEQLDSAESYLARTEQAALENDDGVLLGQVAVAKAHMARVRGDNDQVIELSERALALLPRDDLSSRSIVAVNLGMTQWYRGRLAEAEQALSEAQRAGHGSGNEYVRWTACVFLGRIQVARGGLRRAAASCRQMIQQGGHMPIVALAHYDLGRLSYEGNDLETAEVHLQQGLKLIQRIGSVEFQAGGYASLAFVKQARGETAAAQELLRQVDQLLENPGISPGTRLSCLACHIRVALAQGDLTAAALAADRIPRLEEAASFPDYLRLMLARAHLLLVQGQREVAAEHLATTQGMAARTGWQSVVTQARALQALAAPTPEEALVLLAEALTLAEPEGYVRTFVDLGEPMAALLRRAASQGIAPAYVAKLLAAFEGAAVPQPSPTTAQPPVDLASADRPLVDQPLLDPLSDRELEVLRLLADSLTNQEIAQALYLSINTVKTHLRNIYGKLGVSSRRQAAARAKELGFIP